MNIIAIGPREQDFEYTNGFFSGSITLYGRNCHSNVSYCGSRKERINHNVFSPDQAAFVIAEMKKQVEEDPTVRFMSYDPNQAFDCGEDLVRRTVCLNDKALMDKLNHKISFRQWAQSCCAVHHSDLLPGEECTYFQLTKRYGDYDSFVVQADSAYGGEGTFLLNARNDDKIQALITPHGRYLVSPYIQNNVPVNIHAMIYSDSILLFPTSIQIMRPHDTKLLYHGADFLAVAQADPEALQKFRQSMLALCQRLQAEGYRGVTGVDGMLVGQDAYVLEMNNRFQGSTPLLNLALHEAGLPSMQELNYEAFTQAQPNVCVQNLLVPFSCYTYVANEEGLRPAGHLRYFERDPDVVYIRDDGLCYNQPIAPVASLERVVFRTNIVSVTSQGSVILHPNIEDPEPWWIHKIQEEKDPLFLKIALINQGVFLPDETARFLSAHGGMREGVYNAVDITVDGLVVNSAVRVKFAPLSPFSLELEETSLVLCYCGRKIAPAEIQTADALQDAPLSGVSKVRDICLLATDRVRIQHATNCYFKRNGLGCKFCEVENHEFSFSQADIFSAIDAYIDSPYPFRHFLIGGRSDTPDREPAEMLSILRHIRSRGEWPIYVMCVPPLDLDVLQQFKDAGVTEIAMNLEIWDPTLARRWMPGKGSIPRSDYLRALERAAELWGRSGVVRSAFVVGLEPEVSLLAGIEAVCQAGAAPILSVFRPIPGTEGECLVPPDNRRLLSIYQQAVAICARYGLAPGPTCVPCQNNTLSMPQGFCG